MQLFIILILIALVLGSTVTLMIKPELNKHPYAKYVIALMVILYIIIGFGL